MKLYEQFGEFDSAEEINEAAAAQLAEGTEEGRQNILTIAKENGIDEEDAQDYIDGIEKELCNPLMAAIGKIEVERQAMDLKEIMADWADYVITLCEASEEHAQEYQRAVRRKGKSLAGAIGAILKESWKIKQKIPKEIAEAAGISGARVEMGIPGYATINRILREYYLEG